METFTHGSEGERGTVRPPLSQHRAIAALGLAMVARLCEGKLTWRATYFDLDAGSLRYVQAMPGDVARLVGLPERELYRKARRRAAGRG